MAYDFVLFNIHSFGTDIAKKKRKCQMLFSRIFNFVLCVCVILSHAMLWRFYLETSYFWPYTIVHWILSNHNTHFTFHISLNSRLMTACNSTFLFIELNAISSNFFPIHSRINENFIQRKFPNFYSNIVDSKITVVNQRLSRKLHVHQKKMKGNSWNFGMVFKENFKSNKSKWNMKTSSNTYWQYCHRIKATFVLALI